MPQTTIPVLNCEFLYCFDIGDLYTNVRHRARFIDLITNQLVNPFQNLIFSSEKKCSSHIIEYQSDRGASAIVTSLKIDQPLYVFYFNVPSTLHTTSLTSTLSTFTVSNNGTICLCYEINNKKTVAAKDAVIELTDIRSIIKKDLYNALKTAIKIMEGSIGIKFTPKLGADKNSIVKRVKSFEIIDFDFRFGRQHGHTILKNYYSGKIKALPQDLTGFIRMTRQGVWNNYKRDFQKYFWSQNLGNRTDEIWLVHVKHFFRFHPERDTTDSVIKFYSEVSISIKKLVHLVAHIDFLSRTMSDIKLTSSSNWKSILKLTDNLSEFTPQKPEYSKHDFFGILMTRILEEFNYDRLNLNYHIQLEEIKSSTLSYTSLLSAKRVNRLTILVIIIAVIQLLTSSVDLNVLKIFSLPSFEIIKLKSSFTLHIVCENIFWVSFTIAMIFYFIISHYRCKNKHLRMRLLIYFLKQKLY